MKKTILFIYYKFMSSFTDFNKDNAVGFTGEKIFEQDFLQHLNIPYSDVSGIHSFRKKEIDFLVDHEKSYEVKCNLKNLEDIIIEEWHNIDEQYDSKKPGWFYTTEAKYVVFINKENHLMVILKMGKETIDRYNSFKESYQLIENKVSYNPRNPNPKTNKWQSAYRRVKLAEFTGLFSIYQRPKQSK